MKERVFGPAGASLIEAILIIVILGIGVSMILKVMAPGAGKSHRPEMVARAVFLGQDLVEEIRSKDFEDPPPGSFATEEALPRLNYDDVDDFDNWGAVSPPQDLNDAPLAQFGGFSRSATVCNVAAADLELAPADAAKIETM